MFNDDGISKRINSIMLPEVRECLANIQPQLNGRQQYNTSVKEWLSSIIDLSDFYVYPMNGITHCLDWWMGEETRGIYKNAGDYEWVDETGKDVLYISCPSSIHGNYVDIPTDVPVILDIAYVGTTQIQHIPMTPNIEKVFFSLSKGFGINNIRTGWYFTRRPNIKMHNLTYDAGYYNHVANQYAEEIFKNFSVDYVSNKLAEQQKIVCKNLDINPSDCILLGYTDKKYKEYTRDNNIARLCISDYLKV